MAGIGAKLRSALFTMPTAAGWRRFAIEAAWSLPLALLLCAAGGLAKPGLAEDPGLLLRLALVAIVAPALGEELLFRVLLFPPAHERAARRHYVLSLALFVAWHPPQALLFGPHWAAVVLNPFFLAAVAVIGTALARLYRATGSIWPSVALHWTTIMAWKAFFGAPSPWVAS